MKKITLLILLVVLLTGCHQSEDVSSSNKEEIQEPVVQNEVVEDSRRIQITVDNQNVILQLDDSDISSQILQQMPIDCHFSEYNQVEKASDLRDFVDVQDLQGGYQPQPGDVVVYIPWGCFTVFYGDYQYSDQLIKIGEVVSGIEVFQQIEGGFDGHVEIVEEE